MYKTKMQSILIQNKKIRFNEAGMAGIGQNNTLEKTEDFEQFFEALELDNAVADFFEVLEENKCKLLAQIPIANEICMGFMFLYKEPISKNIEIVEPRIVEPS